MVYTRTGPCLFAASYILRAFATHNMYIVNTYVVDVGMSTQQITSILRSFSDVARGKYKHYKQLPFFKDHDKINTSTSLARDLSLHIKYYYSICIKRNMKFQQAIFNITLVSSKAAVAEWKGLATSRVRFDS